MLMARMTRDDDVGASESGAAGAVPVRLGPRDVGAAAKLSRLAEESGARCAGAGVAGRLETAVGPVPGDVGARKVLAAVVL
ncbi:hypothetical protein D7Y11_12530 [Corallococcus sp. AB018]|nr:hypothetical protein D7Y11_12530 [Corallococcus sp. AB018]